MMLMMSRTSCLLRVALRLGYIFCLALLAATLDVDTTSLEERLQVGPPHQTPRENEQNDNDWILGQIAEPVDGSSNIKSGIHNAPRSNRGESAYPSRRAALSITTTAGSDTSDIGECILLFGAFCNGECVVVF